MILARILGVLGVSLTLAAAGNKPEREQRRIARQFSASRYRSGGGVARALNLRGRTAFNAYGDASARNAAKARRRAIRAAGGVA